jgi:hypothetical protein
LADSLHMAEALDGSVIRQDRVWSNKPAFFFQFRQSGIILQ